jgi:aminoglycoside phosphotransferase family enzyme
MTLQSDPLMLVPWQMNDAARHDVIVAALRRPDAYSDGAPSVEVIETHRAWVFLTNSHAYKLAKAAASHRHDAASLEERLHVCQQELTLNRRLGGDVYQGVAPPLGLPTGELAHFYRGYHALVRAAVAIWHLDDPVQRRHELWRERARRYLRLGVEQIDTARGAGAAPTTTAASTSDAALTAGEQP